MNEMKHHKVEKLAPTSFKGLLSGLYSHGFLVQAEASNSVSSYLQPYLADQDWRIALLDDFNPFQVSVELPSCGA